MELDFHRYFSCFFLLMLSVVCYFQKVRTSEKSVLRLHFVCDKHQTQMDIFLLTKRMLVSHCLSHLFQGLWVFCALYKKVFRLVGFFCCDIKIKIFFEIVDSFFRDSRIWGEFVVFERKVRVNSIAVPT